LPNVITPPPPELSDASWSTKRTSPSGSTVSTSSELLPESDPLLSQLNAALCSPEISPRNSSAPKPTATASSARERSERRQSARLTTPAWGQVNPLELASKSVELGGPSQGTVSSTPAEEHAINEDNPIKDKLRIFTTPHRE
jgi:hypothetical protein